VLLTALCETLDRKNQAEKDLREHGGLTFKNRYDELKPHPCVAIIRDCNVLMARLRRELALSEEEPSDRRPPRLKYGGEVMPRRKEKTRISKGVSPHDIEALRNALREGWPWRLHEDETFRQVPLDTRLQIMISHLTGIFTIACGFPSDPHPSDETVSYLRSQLAVELDEGEKRWGGLALERWRSKDLRMP
jgi:hypothetical protein